MSLERVLITGGAGFVGSHLTERLAGAGIGISVLDDFSRGLRAWVPPAAAVYEVDIRDAAEVESAIAEARPDAIVHLAALHFIPAVDQAPAVARAINVDGTKNVLRASELLRPARVIFASTAAVYPDRPGPIDEDVEPGPIDLYGRTKLAGEQMLATLADSLGSPLVSARLFNVIGPRETNPHVVPEIVAQLRADADVLFLGNVEPRRDYIDVRDVAEALHRLLVAELMPGFSIFNLGSGISISVRELVEECGRILGRKIEIRKDPGRTRRLDRMNLVSDCSALHRTLGWQPSYTLNRTLRDLLAEPD